MPSKRRESAPVVAVGDITEEADLNRILGEIRSEMPPLRGIFHCAGMLDDGILDQMDWGRFSAVTAPKVKGSWLLHSATLRDELDHFVLFSSILSLIGSPGQSNYTAANAFLDALTEHRRASWVARRHAQLGSLGRDRFGDRLRAPRRGHLEFSRDPLHSSRSRH